MHPIRDVRVHGDIITRSVKRMSPVGSAFTNGQNCLSSWIRATGYSFQPDPGAWREPPAFVRRRASARRAYSRWISADPTTC